MRTMAAKARDFNGWAAEALKAPAAPEPSSRSTAPKVQKAAPKCNPKWKTPGRKLTQSATKSAKRELAHPRLIRYMQKHGDTTSGKLVS